VRPRRSVTVNGRPLNAGVRGRMPGAMLRVGGSKAGVRAFLKITRMKPRRIYLRGEPTSPGSKILARANYFLVDVSSASGSHFPQQVQDATRFMKRHLRELKSLRRHKLHAVVDFGVYDDRSEDAPMLSWRFPSKLMKLFSTAGIDGEVSIYDP